MNIASINHIRHQNEQELIYHSLGFQGTEEETREIYAPLKRRNLDV